MFLDFANWILIVGVSDCACQLCMMITSIGTYQFWLRLWRFFRVTGESKVTTWMLFFSFECELIEQVLVLLFGNWWGKSINLMGGALGLVEFYSQHLGVLLNFILNILTSSARDLDAVLLFENTGRVLKQSGTVLIKYWIHILYYYNIYIQSYHIITLPLSIITSTLCNVLISRI